MLLRQATHHHHQSSSSSSSLDGTFLLLFSLVMMMITTNFYVCSWFGEWDDGSMLLSMTGCIREPCPIMTQTPPYFFVPAFRPGPIMVLNKVNFLLAPWGVSIWVQKVQNLFIFFGEYGGALEILLVLFLNFLIFNFFLKFNFWW
jgi:hypothetical protein